MDNSRGGVKAPIHGPTLSIKQAADRLAVSARTIEAWLYQRKIGAFRGRPVRIPEAEIQRILAERWEPASKVWGKE